MDVALCAAVFPTLKKREGMILSSAEGVFKFVTKDNRSQCMMFAYLLSLAALTVQSPVRSIWMKPRSKSWWEDVVNATFTSDDWLKNFRMSKATFFCVCNELWSSVEKNDTMMRKAIPVEQRVALTLWFLSSGAYNRSSLWCIKVYCMCGNKGNLQYFGCNIAAKVHSIPQ